MIELHTGDCRELLPGLALPASAVIVSDPPYGIGYRRNAGGRVAYRKAYGVNIARPNIVRDASTPIPGDDEDFDPAHLLSWRCVLFGANHYYPALPPGGTFHAWDKRSGRSLEDNFSDVEFVWTSWRCKSRIISHLYKGVLQEGSENGKRKLHVSQKPVRVMAQLIEWFVPAGSLVVDPYAGSGSTLVACVKTGRSAVGIEINPRDVAIARRRLADAATPLLDVAERQSSFLEAACGD